MSWTVRVSPRGRPDAGAATGRCAEGLAPLPDGFVPDGDATLRKEVFDVADAESPAAMEPDGVAHDVGRESIAVVADR